jgi:hypothetical protein
MNLSKSQKEYQMLRQLLLPEARMLILVDGKGQMLKEEC